MHIVHATECAHNLSDPVVVYIHAAVAILLSQVLIVTADSTKLHQLVRKCKEFMFQEVSYYSTSGLTACSLLNFAETF